MLQKKRPMKEHKGTSLLSHQRGSPTDRLTDGNDKLCSRVMPDRPDPEGPEEQKETLVHVGRQEMWDSLASRDIYINIEEIFQIFLFHAAKAYSHL